MLPMPGIADIRVYWLKVRRPGTVLHGYLLYSASDHRFPTYMADDGIADIEQWTGPECGIFVFQSPPEGWAMRAIKTNHVWSQLLKEVYSENDRIEMAKIGDDYQLDIDGRITTIKELFAGCNDNYAQRDLIKKVLEHFSLPPTAHPCIILFHDLYGRQFWRIGLDDLLNSPEGDLRKALKRWFGGAEFERLLRGARHANRE